MLSWQTRGLLACPSLPLLPLSPANAKSAWAQERKHPGCAQKHRGGQIRTHRHTNTHRHTHTHTKSTNKHTQTQTHKHRHKQTQTHTNTQTHRHKSQQPPPSPKGTTILGQTCEMHHAEHEAAIAKVGVTRLFEKVHCSCPVGLNPLALVSRTSQEHA